MEVYDFLLGDGKDLRVEGGDFVVGESTAQHQEALIVESKGEYKENPLTGVGALGYIDDDPGLSRLAADIAEAFVGDGMNVTSVRVVNGEIVTDAVYK